MADVTDCRKTSEENKEHLSSVPNVANENHDSVVNKTPPSRDSYWFAHGGTDDVLSANNRNSSKSPEIKESQNAKEREERIRMFREQQEEERVRRMKELEQSFILSRKFREQQEEERRRKIEDARNRENERRQQVEERKRLIWEAEQERKGAILRRNLEREARIEARRNAQRNSLSFAFGSSTPRTFDLDLAALGRSSTVGSPLMSAVSTRRSDDRDFSAKRATSINSLDQKSEATGLWIGTDNSDVSCHDHYRSKSVEPEPTRVNVSKQIAFDHMSSEQTKACLTMDNSVSFGTVGNFPIFASSPASRWLVGSGAMVGDDCMSWSTISLSSASRGRRRTDLIPLSPRDRSATPHSVSRGNASLRAVSMTRLDQLAQPRRWYMEIPMDNSSTTSTATTPTGHRTVSPCMSRSMMNLAHVHHQVARKLTHPPNVRNNPRNMSRSMFHLPGSTPQGAPPVNYSRGSPSPICPPDISKPATTKLRSAQSMTHLAIAPRLTRAARLRADALANARFDGQRTTSMVNLSKEDHPGRMFLSAKATSRSPSRPQSSMSGRSEVSIPSSQASAVSLRPKPPVRKPRPVSIAGTTVDKSMWNSSVAADRKPRPPERNVSVPKPPRAKSNEPDNSAKLSVSKKPVPPPKSAQVLAKARTHLVPTKDNLRKNVKAVPTVQVDASSTVLVNNEDQGISLPEAKVAPVQLPPEKSSEKDSVAVNVVNADEVPEAVPQVIPADVLLEVNNSKYPDDSKTGTDDLLDQRDVAESNLAKTRITSEDEARAALAEKRRIAREQAEREAELEKQRQEESQRLEEEKKRKEELEQKRQEEEQIRLAELHRKMEEEKLKKAIEEQEQKDQEDKERREEEARQKAEKEEQEKKAREEAEKQRIELEERLRKEEEERAERKKRVQQIMSRTRGRGAQPPNNQMNSPADNSPMNMPASEKAAAVSSETIYDNLTSAPVNNGDGHLIEMDFKNVSANSSVIPYGQGVMKSVSQSNGQKTDSFDVNDLIRETNVRNGFHGDNVKTNCVNSVPNRTLYADSAFAVQTNGYSSHEDMSLTSSPEERSEKSDVSDTLLLDLQSTRTSSNNTTKGSVEINQLLDLSSENSVANSCNDNYVIDVVNSNMVSTENAFLVFEDNLAKKQENPITDLLS